MLRKQLALSVSAAIAITLIVPSAAGSQLSLTALDRPQTGKEMRLAVRWGGKLPLPATVWIDADSDGRFTSSEIALESAPISEAIQVLPVTVPSWAEASCSMVRLALGTGTGTVVAMADASTCAWTPGFSTAVSVSNVEALVVFDDGSGPALFVAGHFTTAGGIPSSYIARWLCSPGIFADGFESGNTTRWSVSVQQ